MLHVCLYAQMFLYVLNYDKKNLSIYTLQDLDNDAWCEEEMCDQGERKMLRSSPLVAGILERKESCFSYFPSQSPNEAKIVTPFI